MSWRSILLNTQSNSNTKTSNNNVDFSIWQKFENAFQELNQNSKISNEEMIEILVSICNAFEKTNDELLLTNICKFISNSLRNNLNQQNSNELIWTQTNALILLDFLIKIIKQQPRSKTKLLNECLSSLSEFLHQISKSNIASSSSKNNNNGNPIIPLDLDFISILLPFISIRNFKPTNTNTNLIIEEELLVFSIQKFATNSLRNVSHKRIQNIRSAHIQLIYRTILDNISIFHNSTKLETTKSSPPMFIEQIKLLKCHLRLLLVLLSEGKLHTPEFQNSNNNNDQKQQPDSSKLSSIDLKELVDCLFKTSFLGFSNEKNNNNNTNDVSKLEFKNLKTAKSEADQLSIIRDLSIQCISCLAKPNSKLLYSFWYLLLPISVSSSFSQKSLLNLLVNETNPNVRISCVRCLSFMFENTKSYLSAASESPKQMTSFVALSQTLGSTVKQIHQSLVFCLSSDFYLSGLEFRKELIKFASVFVRNFPYEKLGTHYLVEITKFPIQLLQLQTKGSEQLRVSCMVCLTSIFERGSYPELSQSVLNEHFFELLFSLTQMKKIMFQNNDSEIDFSFLTETMNTFSAIVGSYFDSFSNLQIGKLFEIVFDCFDLCKKQQLQTQTQTQLESLNVSCLSVLSSFLQITLEREMFDQNEQLLKRFLGVSQTFEFFIHCSISISIQICSLLSNIPPKSVPLLLNQSNFLSFLSNCLIDTTPNVYSTGLRAESAKLCGTLFSSLSGMNYFETNDDHQVETNFIINTPKILLRNLSNDQNMNVRMRSCWALSNLCESIVEQLSSETTNTTTTKRKTRFSSFLNENAFELFLKTALKDHEKVKVLAIRLLGQIVSCIDLKLKFENNKKQQNEQLQQIPLFSSRTWDSIVISISEVLKANLAKGSAKVKWNVCHAFSSILKVSNHQNNNLLSNQFLGGILDCLVNLIRTNDNLKVKINATSAILSVSERNHFGNILVNLEELMISELEKCENISVFSQLKYKESLFQKISECILHLSMLFNDQDIQSLKNLLRPEQLRALGNVLNNFKKYEMNNKRQHFISLLFPDEI